MTQVWEGRGGRGAEALSQPTTVVSLFHRCAEKVQNVEALQHLLTCLRTRLQANIQFIPLHGLCPTSCFLLK